MSSIVERGKGNWWAILEGKDQAGKRQRKWHKLEAKSRREAQTETAAIITQREQGSYIDQEKDNVGGISGAMADSNKTDCLPAHVRALQRDRQKKHKPSTRQRTVEEPERADDR